MVLKNLTDDEIELNQGLAEAEGLIVGVEHKHMPEGMCVVTFHGEITYIGPISRSEVRPGAKVYLNPADLTSIDRFMNKRMN